MCGSNHGGLSLRYARLRWRYRALSNGVRPTWPVQNGGRKSVMACSSTTTRTRGKPTIDYFNLRTKPAWLLALLNLRAIVEREPFRVVFWAGEQHGLTGAGDRVSRTEGSKAGDTAAVQIKA